jgi:hypothetical protein
MGEVSIAKVKAGVILRDLKIKAPDDISVEDIAWTRGGSQSRTNSATWS